MRQRSANHPELIFPWWCLFGAVNDDKIQVMPHNFAADPIREGVTKDKTKQTCKGFYVRIVHVFLLSMLSIASTQESIP